jgi:hypothetical protein
MQPTSTTTTSNTTVLSRVLACTSRLREIVDANSLVLFKAYYHCLRMREVEFRSVNIRMSALPECFTWSAFCNGACLRYAKYIFVNEETNGTEIPELRTPSDAFDVNVPFDILWLSRTVFVSTKQYCWNYEHRQIAHLEIHPANNEQRCNSRMFLFFSSIVPLRQSENTLSLSLLIPFLRHLLAPLPQGFFCDITPHSWNPLALQQLVEFLATLPCCYPSQIQQASEEEAEDVVGSLEFNPPQGDEKGQEQIIHMEDGFNLAPSANYSTENEINLAPSANYYWTVGDLPYCSIHVQHAQNFGN